MPEASLAPHKSWCPRGSSPGEGEEGRLHLACLVYQHMGEAEVFGLIGALSQHARGAAGRDHHPSALQVVDRRQLEGADCVAHLAVWEHIGFHLHVHYCDFR